MIINRIWQFIVNFLKSYFVIIALILIFLLSSYSFFQTSFFHVHDFTHGARIAEMARALDEGQFPVRWSANFGYGFGMPLFNFYLTLLVLCFSKWVSMWLLASNYCVYLSI